ncbi:MAG: hypothetical protein K8F62_15405 [Pseudorhodoplanes sp.]|nr:hypothetical protein [Pseudorhodoplanes sp.]
MRPQPEDLSSIDVAQQLRLVLLEYFRDMPVDSGVPDTELSQGLDQGIEMIDVALDAVP